MEQTQEVQAQEKAIATFRAHEKYLKIAMYGAAKKHGLSELDFDVKLRLERGLLCRVIRIPATDRAMILMGITLTHPEFERVMLDVLSRIREMIGSKVIQRLTLMEEANKWVTRRTKLVGHGKKLILGSTEYEVEHIQVVVVKHKASGLIVRKESPYTGLGLKKRTGKDFGNLTVEAKRDVTQLWYEMEAKLKDEKEEEK